MSSEAKSLELISFVTCPFVQRAVLMLHEKKVAHTVRFIDLQNKPDWFLEQSPRGKVPLLVIDGKTSLFESQAICEYLDDVYEPQLRSEVAVERARERAFFSASGEDYFLQLWFLETASTEEKFNEIKEKLTPLLERLSSDLGDRDFLSGDGTRFGFADVGFAPLHTRTSFYKEEFKVDLLAPWPNLVAWQQRVLAKDSVTKSLPAKWKDAFMTHATKSESYMLTSSK